MDLDAVIIINLKDRRRKNEILGFKCSKIFFEHFLDAIIGGIIGGFIERYFAHSSERRRINKILIKIKNRIYSLLKEDYLVDDLFKSFKELKIFFDRNYELLEYRAIKPFTKSG